MNNKITIAIDAMGGENSPAKNIEGITPAALTAVLLRLKSHKLKKAI